MSLGWSNIHRTKVASEIHKWFLISQCVYVVDHDLSASFGLGTSFSMLCFMASFWQSSSLQVSRRCSDRKPCFLSKGFYLDRSTAEEVWDEPGDCAQLGAVQLETKIAGRTSGTTLFVVHSKRRDGRLMDCDPDQQFKLFLVASSVVRLFIEKPFILWRNPCLIPQHVIISMQWVRAVHTQVAHMDLEVPLTEFQLSHSKKCKIP